MGKIWFSEVRGKNKKGDEGKNQAYEQIREYVMLHKELPTRNTNNGLFCKMVALMKRDSYREDLNVMMKGFLHCQLKQDIDRDDGVLKALREIRKTASLIISNLD